MTVNVNTAAAGTVNGAIAVNFFSAGAVGGVSNGLGEVGVGQASYGVSGTIKTVVNVINQASPLINNSDDQSGQRAGGCRFADGQRQRHQRCHRGSAGRAQRQHHAAMRRSPPSGFVQRC